MMRTIIFLTLLAFMASTVVLVAAAKGNDGTVIFSFMYKGKNKTITEEEFDAETNECPKDDEEKCSYEQKTACYCRPQFFGYNRGSRYFYSPYYNECFEHVNLNRGCNSFDNRRDCRSKCRRGVRPRQKLIKNRN
uniref:Putative secreted protein n=1 Tax=Amblyomma cajennense TaxID=34607 RepID=A0A023FCT6_AMBCJ